MLMLIDGAKCSSELEGKEIDHVRDSGVVKFLGRSAEELGPLKWKGGGKLFPKFFAGTVT